MATISKYRKKDGSISYTGQIRIKRKGTVIHTEAFTHSKKAIVTAWAKRRETELAAPGALEAMGHSVTLGDVLRWYLAFSNSKGSKSTTIGFLIKQPIANLDAVKATVHDFLHHAESRRPAAPPTIMQDFVWIRLAMKAYKVAKNAPVATQNVDDAVALLKASRVVGASSKRSRRPTLDEMSRIVSFFARSDARQQIPMSEIVLFALFSGRREAEICRIRRADRDGSRILVRAMKNPKGVRDTWVFLTDEAIAIMDRQPPGEFYFPYNSKSVSAAFTRTCKLLEIDGLRFHDLRHECASRLFELGWEIPRVAGVTGHQAWATLQRYVHLRDRGVVDKYAGWEWLPAVEEV